MPELDPRTHAYRPDRADVALKDKVEAGRFVAPELARVYPQQSAVADMRIEPDPGAARVSQLITGEQVKVFHVKDGFAWCQSCVDDYVGYVAERDLDYAFSPPTHRVTARASFNYFSRSIKDGISWPLAFGALLAVEDSSTGGTDDLVALAEGTFVFRRHLEPIGTTTITPRQVLKIFENVPYLWGGRSTFGIDCSGLIQHVCAAAGLSAPRDSDQQAASPELGDALEPFNAARARAGDLVFWKGHVGLMADDDHLCHANGYHMQVVTEPLADAVMRIESLYARPIGLRKLGLFDL